MAAACILSTILAGAAGSGDYKWPETRGYKDPWPKDLHAYKVLNERWGKASKKPLGKEADTAAIKKTVLRHIKWENSSVSEVRWLSPTLVMAFASWHGRDLAAAGFFYVIHKQKDKWEIVIYYQLYVS